MDLNLIIWLCAAAASAALFAYTAFVAPQRIRVRRLEFAFPNLPAAFDGYTILHLSDLHTRRFGRLERRLMRLIAEQGVDTCVVTGDMMSDQRACGVFLHICSAIRHRDPIFATLGNSERKPWVDEDTLIEALTCPGLELLVNSSAVVTRGSDRIVIAGVDDPYSRRDDVRAALKGVDPADFVVFLAHCPSVAPEAIAGGADLILSGHTHGGQVRFPMLPVLFTHMLRNKRLNDGVYGPDDLRRILGVDPGHSVLFVNRGVGTSRLYIRFRCPPEIAYITLRRS